MFAITLRIYRKVGVSSALDQDTRGHGFPLAEHLNEAVVPFKTVSFLGEIVTFGAEHVWPGSPFIPVLPRGPASPLKLC